MAASTSSLVRINDTDANFRAWLQAIFNALVAGGLIQTADTGQINTSTVTRPLAANTSQGYAIFRSDDAAGGLNNFYFKIEFGSGAATNTPAIWLTVGWGSDGAGTITGNTSGRIQFQPGSNSATPINSNFGVGTGYFCLGMWTDSGSSNYMIASLERTRDANGDVQDEVFLYGGGTGAAIVANLVVPRVGTVPTNDTTGGAGWRICSATAATYGGNKGVGVLAPQKGGFLMEAMNIYQVNNTDFGSNQVQYTMSVYGATHTYITGGLSSTLGLAGRLLLRYE